MAETYTVEAQLIADINDYTSKLSQAARQMSGFEKSTTASTANIKKAISGIGKGMTIAGAAVTAMGVTALKGFGDFQQSLNQAAVIAGGTSKDIGGLADVANRMGAELPLSAKDAAAAMVSMARDGANIKTIKAEFPAIAQAATAAGSDLQATASIVQQSMNLWGDSLKSPQRAAAILTQTANVSNASVEDMQQVLADVGGTATSVGYSMQDVSTAVGLLTNKGIPAAQAAQNLNNAITHMIKPSKSAQGMMDQLGISYYDAQGKMKPINQVASELSKSMEGLTDKQKQNALSVLFGQTGYKVMNGLMDATNDKTGSATTSWEGMSKAISDASKDGATATKFLSDQASEMQKNIGSKIEQVGGNWESLTNKSLAAKGGITGDFLDMTNSALNWAAESKSPFAEMARSFIGLSPVIGPAMTATGAFITNAGKIGGAAKSAVSGVFGLAKGFASITKNTVGAVARMFGIAGSQKAVGATAPGAAAGEKAVGKSAGMAAKEVLQLGAAFALIGLGILGIGAAFFLIAQGAVAIGKAGSPAVVALGAIIVSIAALAAIFAVLGPALTAGAVGIAAFGFAVLAAGVGVAAFGIGVLAIGAGIILAAKGIALLSQNLTSIVPVLTAVGAGFAMMITSFLGTLASQSPVIIAAFTLMITELLNSLTTIIPQAVDAFLQIMIGIFNGITTNAPTIISSFTNMVVTIFNALTEALPKFIKAGTDFIVALLDGIADNMPTIIASFVNMLVNILEALTDALPKLIKAGADFIISLLKGIAQQLPGIISATVDVIAAFINGIANNLGKIADAGINLLVKFVNAILDRLPKLADAAVEAVKKFVYGVGYAIGDVIGSGGDLISAFLKGISDGFKKANDHGKQAGEEVKNGASGVSLHGAGSAIMGGLLDGMKSTWEAGKSFVSGIGPWIKAHKGPITYDRKLLIPAGGAIMGGLNDGLSKGFTGVMSNVSSMAGNIASAVSGSADYRINAVSSGLDIGTDGTLSVDMTRQQQPATINLIMGGSTYRGFVDDISTQQGQTATLNRASIV